MDKNCSSKKNIARFGSRVLMEKACCFTVSLNKNLNPVKVFSKTKFQRKKVCGIG
jgi:hypothetical protein